MSPPCWIIGGIHRGFGNDYSDDPVLKQSAMNTRVYRDLDVLIDNKWRERLG
jgi:uncharacterized lipoprotein YehR (DUF1307 family)